MFIFSFENNHRGDRLILHCLTFRFSFILIFIANTVLIIVYFKLTFKLEVSIDYSIELLTPSANNRFDYHRIVLTRLIRLSGHLNLSHYIIIWLNCHNRALRVL